MIPYEKAIDNRKLNHLHKKMNKIRVGDGYCGKSPSKLR